MIRHTDTEIIIMKKEVYTHMPRNRRIMQGHNGEDQGWSGGKRGSGESMAHSLY